MAIRKNPFRKNQHSLEDANSMVREGKTHKQASHDVEVVAKMAGDSHREVSPKPSVSTVGDRRYKAEPAKPRKGIRKSFDQYGEESKLGPWDKIRYAGEAREAELKASFLKGKGKK